MTRISKELSKSSKKKVYLVQNSYIFKNLWSNRTTESTTFTVEYHYELFNQGQATVRKVIVTVVSGE